MNPTDHFTALDHAMMSRAIALAERGRAIATPNPFVGCVIVKEGRIVGEGFTQAGGRPHAEAEALREAGEQAAGATAYVTLEPCVPHAHSRGPACADLLIAAKVARVVSALHDPFAAVDGQGHERLRAAGIALQTGLMAPQVRKQLRGFLSRAERGRPFVILKVAASLDGKTALANGVSQWITGADARRDVHALRREMCALLTGIGTVLADDPQLTVRDVPCTRQPRRVLLDSRLDVADDARILQGEPPWIVTATGDEARAQALRQRGIEVLRMPTEPVKGKVDLATMMRALGERRLNTVMVETGARLNASLLTAGVVDEIVAYVAPSILGDDARGLFAIPALSRLADKIPLAFTDVRQVGADLRMTMTVVRDVTDG